MICRGEALARLLTVAETARQFIRGCELDTLHREAVARTGRDWCQRTIRRDLAVLQRLGFVDRLDTAGSIRWRWVGLRPLIETRPEVVRAAS